LEKVPDGRYRERIRPETAKMLFQGRNAFRPDYAAIRCPVLAIYAFQDETWLLPDTADERLREAVREYIERVNDRFGRRCIESARAEISDIRIVEYENTSHYCFLDREADVIREMDRFLQDPRQGGEVG
jgi:pimeloyl-ACP methyl ester carboxylesterase